MNWAFSFDRPEWLWLLAAIPVIVLVSLRSLAGLEPYRRVAAVALRCLVIVALSLALARIQYVKRHDNVAVMFVLDRSRSIPEERREAAQEYVKACVKPPSLPTEGAIGSDDRFGIIGFDGQADVDLITSAGGGFIMFGSPNEPDRTDIAAGLRMAMASMPQGYARRVVLITDGNENLGNLLEEIEVATASQVSVDVLPLEYHHDREIMFDRIVAPAHASRDTKVPLHLIVKSRRDTEAKLTLYHNGVEVPLKDPVLQLNGGMQPNRTTISMELQGGYIHRFEAQITPVNPADDAIAENNQAAAFTFVGEQGRVLVLTEPGSTDEQRLIEALQREKVEVELRGTDQFSMDLLSLQEYGAVMLSNVPADTFNDEQQKALASYVRDFGGGLVMTGGNEGFGAGGWIGTPIEEISPVSFEIKHKKIIPRGALAIIMHSCEIPRGNYWGEQVAMATVDTISSLDYLGVICYSYRVNGPNWDVPLAPAADKPTIKAKIKQMQIGDMPDFASTMSLAVTALMGKKDAAQRHMIIISDGDPSPPTATTIQFMVDNKITCSTVGIGYGVHVVEKTLRDIAKQTGGRFYPVKNPKQLPQIFVKEAKVVRRPLIDDRPFQPRLPFGFGQTTQGIADADLPPLGGLVMTQAKADAMIPIIRRGDDGDDPVLAHWNYEMGKMAVFTSGWWKKWGSNWVGWDKFGKFWSQVLRWSMRQEASADFDIVTRFEGNRGQVIIEALNKDASYLNFLRFDGLLVTPSMETEPLHLAQTGPGRYEASFDIKDHGNYLINLRYPTSDKQVAMIRTGLSLPYSPEFRDLSANLSLLSKVVDRTGGRMLRMDPITDQLFKRDLPPAQARLPVWRWVVTWLLLPLFLLDVASRRLASIVAMSIYVELAVLVVGWAIMYEGRASFWGYLGMFVLAEVIGWSIRYRSIVPTVQFFTATAAVLGRVGQRSAASVSQLKDVSRKVREDLDGKATEQPVARPDTIPLEPAPDRSTRFDVGDKAAAQPAKDIAESLGKGAAKKLDEPAASDRPGRQQGETGDLTSRLLKAKKRAQQELDHRKEGGEGDER